MNHFSAIYWEHVYRIKKRHSIAEKFSYLSKLPSLGSVENFQITYFLSGKRCGWCGKQVDKLEFDCILPIYHGGGLEVENLAMACPTCNRRKGYSYPSLFAQKLHLEGVETKLVLNVLKKAGMLPLTQQELPRIHEIAKAA